MLGDFRQIDVLHGKDVPVEDDPALQEQVGRLVGPEGELSEGHVVPAAAPPAPFPVLGRQVAHIGQVDGVDEIPRGAEQGAEESDPAGVDLAGAGDASHPEALQVGVLGSEDGVHAGDVHLLAQGMQVVRGEKQVFLGVEPVLRMSPVAAREDPQLTAGDELLQLGLHCGEIDRRCARRDLPGECGRPDRIGGKGADDIHPVQRAQMVEVDRMVVKVLPAHQEVADDPGIGGDRQPDRVLNGAHRRLAMDIGADAAQALGEQPGILRRAIFQDGFDAAK